MLRIYRYNTGYRRGGGLQGVFVVDEHGETCLRALIQSRRGVYYGEVLGKHSEVSEILEADELREIEASQDDIAVVLRVLGIKFDRIVAKISGHCPLQCAGTYEFVDCYDEDRIPAAMLAWARGEELEEEE